MPAQKRSSDSLEVEEEDEEESSEQQERNQYHESPPQKVKAEENDDDDHDDEEEEDGDGDEGEEETQGGGGVKDGDEGDSDGTASSSSSSDADTDANNNTKDEFVCVKLSDIRKEVQCPICLGIIRKTRTVMECLHRFCRECIDKSMRLGNNECPACRTHCASRRSLRDDPNYDALIAAIYPDIDKYEEEEMAFHEEEKSRNKQHFSSTVATCTHGLNTFVKTLPPYSVPYIGLMGQIQASIAQTIRRQSEALVKRRSTAKATAAAFVRRSRRWRNSRTQGTEGSDDDADGNGNEGGRESSSADEHCINSKVKRHKRWTGQRFSQPSSAGVDADGGSDENDDVEAGIDNRGPSPGLVGTPEVLTWGKGGVRSHTRYGSVSGSNGKNARGSRLNKLSDYLRNLEENENESRSKELDYMTDSCGVCIQLDVHLTLLPLDEQSMRSLPQPYLCCRPTLSVKHLCQVIFLPPVYLVVAALADIVYVLVSQFIALQTSVEADDIEIVVVKEPHFTNIDGSLISSISSGNIIPKIHSCKYNLQMLEPKETLAGLQSNCSGISKASIELGKERRTLESGEGVPRAIKCQSFKEGRHSCGRLSWE
ncbi:hypothetical protein C5167_043177 [Papaver somniferum]|uniref:RING-type domain-containing protein n=2 Tax=Magnoliopsida TaxID=3398 RepID=A0A4Y7L8R0_PAPSO|nr:hypothetical protein C5167_043177 [Papaver somniferum]